MSKSTKSTKSSTFTLELVAGKKMSEYWLDFQSFAKEHKSKLAAAKAARDKAIREANDAYAKIKDAEDAAIKAAYAEFQRIQSEFQNGRAERRAVRAAAAEAKTTESKPTAEVPAEPAATELDVDTTGMTAEEIELLKAATAA